MSEIRTRFAPSPTGFLHLGNIRSALYPWAFARKHGGVFILRIEDTDVVRSTPEAVQAILDSMQWLDLDYDEGPYYQMQHMARYREVIEQMLAAGSAYHCYASAEKLDKRHGARGVMQYRDDGYLAEAVVNYLARLGWAHGDEEIFSRDQFVGW